MTPPTSAGWPSTYLESHTMIATTYRNPMVGLVAQGAFEAIEVSRFVFLERLDTYPTLRRGAAPA